MKNIIKFLKNTLLNNKGKMSAGVMAGLTAGTFVAVVGYSVYNAYQNTAIDYKMARPASYSAERNIYTDKGSLDIQSMGVSDSNYVESGLFRNGNGVSASKTPQSGVNKEASSFDAARAYLDSQKEVQRQAAGAIPAGAEYGRQEINSYSNGEAYNPFGSTYEESIELKGQGNYSGSRRAAYDAQGMQGSSADGKGTQGKNTKNAGNKTSANKAAAQPTQINKLQASSGGSSSDKSGGSAGASGGASSAISGGSTSFNTAANKGGDSSARNLPQVNTVKTANSNSFKGGRAGSMGGFNVGVNGNEISGSGNGAKGASNDLKRASVLSTKSRMTKHSVGAKHTAEAAFDGNRSDAKVTEIDDNARIDTVASKFFDTLSDDPDNKDLNKNPLDNIVAKTKELSKLKKKLTGLLWATALGALAFSLGIYFARQIAEPYGMIVAGVLSAIALGLLIWSGISMGNIVKEMANPRFKGLNSDVGSKKGLVWTTCILSGLLVAAGWTPMWKNAWTNITNFFKTGNVAPSAMSQATGKGFVGGIKAWFQNINLRTFTGIGTSIASIFGVSRKR